MTRALRLAAACSLVLASAAPLRASDGTDTLASIHAAAVRFGLDPLVLIAIGYHESNLEPWALNVAGAPVFPAALDDAVDVIQSHREDDTRGRMDVGALQINTRWLARVNALGSIQLAPADLLDPAVASILGAALLKNELDATGGDLWRAVARYHTGPERPDNRERGKRYAASVRRIYEYLLARAARMATERPAAEPTPTGTALRPDTVPTERPL